ncbi:uncharacterized protein [Hetaerina americana]|uniref:uncharacterized protein n=1 Tax=Hetaerina americana TaxID=62018 RepID=UPI003A7F60B0
MFEIGDEVFNAPLNDIQQSHEIMNIQGPFLTRMQRFVQRVEVHGGEQRRSCIKEMHAISSTPIRTKNVHRGSPLQDQQTSARPSIYSVPLSPNVSPVGKSNACLRSPSAQETANHEDANGPSSSTPGRKSQVRIGMTLLTQQTVGNDFKRNVSRRLPMATAIQRSEQYVPLEIVSDDDVPESKAFTRRTKSCRRPMNNKRKASVHFKTNSYRDSGRGGSAAMSSGTRTHFSEEKHPNNCSVQEGQESDSDSGLSHCTDGPSRTTCHQDERLDHHSPIGREVETRNQISESPKFSVKNGRNRKVSRVLQRVNNPPCDYEPLEIVSDDEEDNNMGKRCPNNQLNGNRKSIKGVRGNVVLKTGRGKLMEPASDDDIKKNKKRSVTARTSIHRKLRQNSSRHEIMSETEAVIDSLLKEDDQCEKENKWLSNGRQYKRKNNEGQRASCSEESVSESYLSISQSARSCSESFEQNKMNEVSYQSIGSVSGGFDGSAMEVDEDDDVEGHGQDLCDDDLIKRERGNYSAVESDVSYGPNENLNASGFTYINSRMRRMNMSGLVENKSRTRYGESFDSDSHCENTECDQYAQVDDEDMDESGNLSGLRVHSQFDHQAHQGGNQLRMNNRIKKGYVRSSGHKEAYPSDYESQDEMNADISGFTDYKERKNVQALIQSRNNSYLHQDSFDAQMSFEGSERSFMSPGGSGVSKKNNRILRAKNSSQNKGVKGKDTKKLVQPKASSYVTLKQNLSRQGTQKQLRKSVQEVAVNAHKKGSKAKEMKNSQTESSETTGLESLPVKTKQGRTILAKGKIARQKLVKESQKSQSGSSETAGSGSSPEVRGRKSCTVVFSESKEFESPLVKRKRGRPKSTKASEDSEQPIKGDSKSSSETAKSESPPRRRKRGQPLLRRKKKNAESQNEVQMADENCGSQSEQLGSTKSSSPSNGRKRGRPGRKDTNPQVDKKAEKSSEGIQSETDGQNPPRKRKCVRAPRRNNRKQKIDPSPETLQMSGDGLLMSSSDSETDKSVSKRRTLFSSEKFNNELSLNQNQVLSEGKENKTEANHKLSPLRDKKKHAESSSDYLRKKVLTMRLGHSAFHNSVIEENALIVTSTPKKSLTESKISSTSKVESNSDEAFEDKGVNSSKVTGKLSTSGRMEGDLENHEKLNKSQGNEEVNGPLLLPPVNGDDMLNKKIVSFDEAVPKSSDKGSSSKSGKASTSFTAESKKEVVAAVPVQSLKVDSRILGPPSMSTSAVGLGASSKGMASRASVPVLIDGQRRDLELFADYSKITLRSRQKESKDNVVHYGAALDVLGLGSGFIHLTPGTEKGLQNPKSYNMVFLILDGQVLVKIQENNLLANPGDFFAVPKGCKYNLTGSGDRNAIVAYFKSKAA